MPCPCRISTAAGGTARPEPFSAAGRVRPGSRPKAIRRAGLSAGPAETPRSWFGSSWPVSHLGGLHLLSEGFVKPSAAENPSSRLAKSQVDALLAEQIMMCRLERLHAVIAQAIGAAPDHDVAVLERYAAGPVGPFQPAEQKNRRNAERDRDDRRTEVALVLVLMQRQLGAGQVLVDEGTKPPKPACAAASRASRRNAA